MIYPWFLVKLLGAVARPLGYQTFVMAQGGPGFHRGRLGADRIFFRPRDPDSTPLPRPLRGA